jgi:hypothetical protein
MPGREKEWRRLLERAFSDGQLSEAEIAHFNEISVPGVDETSFRGAFLKSCRNVIDKRLLEAAWEHKLPEAAIEYGRALLAAADAAETSPRIAHRNFLLRLGLVKSAEPPPLPEQLDIVRAAGRWFIFWGERGHPIRAYF